MPEEINRIVTDSISDLLFAPTQTAVKNLHHEGLYEVTSFTGDVMYDSVLYYQSWIQKAPEKYKTMDIPSKYFLATIHRAENTDKPENLQNIFRAFANLDHAIVLPIHPRTRKILKELVKLPDNICLIDPVGYLQMMKLTMDADKIMTDSGGLQKEAYFLNKQCITLRTETEWVETLHDQWNIITGSDPNNIEKAANGPLPVAPRRNDFGDGNAAKIILEKLTSF
jgi:UDP-N-acetylglucosamine 2-epimerase